MTYGMTDDEIVEHMESLGDQINDLEAKLDELQNRLEAANYARADAMALAAMRQSCIEELEQKLAKAVGAINVAIQHEPKGLYPDHVPNYWLLRTTLVELKGESHDGSTTEK